MLIHFQCPILNSQFILKFSLLSLYSIKFKLIFKRILTNTSSLIQQQNISSYQLPLQQKEETLDETEIIIINDEILTEQNQTKKISEFKLKVFVKIYGLIEEENDSNNAIRMQFKEDQITIEELIIQVFMKANLIGKYKINNVIIFDSNYNQNVRLINFKELVINNTTYTFNVRLKKQTSKVKNTLILLTRKIVI